VIPYLPEALQSEVLGEKFTLNCLERFKELDQDGNGSLEPTELYPVIIDMTQAHHLSLDLDQCARFTDIFDDERTGVISQKEFVNFARFLVVMTFLQTEDGQKVLDLVQPSLEQPVPSSPQAAAPASPQAVGHLTVDLEYYQSRAERLTKENAEQRSLLLEMEERMRAMEERVERQEMKLRHADVDLNSSGSRLC